MSSWPYIYNGSLALWGWNIPVYIIIEKPNTLYQFFWLVILIRVRRSYFRTILEIMCFDKFSDINRLDMFKNWSMLWFESHGHHSIQPIRSPNLRPASPYMDPSIYGWNEERLTGRSAAELRRSVWIPASFTFLPDNLSLELLVIFS